VTVGFVPDGDGVGDRAIVEPSPFEPHDASVNAVTARIRA
jgi:hypothetical protein